MEIVLDVIQVVLAAILVVLSTSSTRSNETDTEKRKRRSHYCLLCDGRQKEARDAGFIRPDGNSRILKKVVDTEKGTLTFQVDWEAEEN